MRFQTTLLLAASAITLVGCGQIQPYTAPVQPVAAVTAEPFEGTKFDGVYVGMPESTAGGCRNVFFEMAIVVKRSHARMVWQYKEGRELLGDVSPDGSIEMHSQHETYLLDLVGKIEGDTLTATTNSTSAHGDCAYSLRFQKRDLSKSN